MRYELSPLGLLQFAAAAAAQPTIAFASQIERTSEEGGAERGATFGGSGSFPSTAKATGRVGPGVGTGGPSVSAALQIRTGDRFDLLAVNLTEVSPASAEFTPTWVYIVGTKADGSRVALDRGTEGIVDPERIELDSGFSELVSAEISTFSRRAINVHNIQLATGRDEPSHETLSVFR